MFRTSFRLTGVAFAALLLAGVTSAQMSGTYTVDPKGSGNRNFKDFPNAAYQVFVQGVSGPVVFDVAPGTYSKAFNLGPVKGVSSKNTITFKSRTKHAAKIAPVTILDYSPNFPVSWYVFDGPELTGIGASGSCTDLEIRNCKMRTKLVTNSAFLKNDPIQRWKVHHNTFFGGGCSFHSAQAMEIHHNHAKAFNLFEGWRAEACRLHHNLEMGYGAETTGAAKSKDIEVWGCEVAHNNYLRTWSDSWHACGAGKFAGNL